MYETDKLRCRDLPEPFRLDQNGGSNSRQHRSIRPADVDHRSVSTYITNHWDRRLAARGKSQPNEDPAVGVSLAAQVR